MNYYQRPLEDDNPHVLEDHRLDDISAPAIHRYVNILMDKWFKKILGAESNKETLLGILRELIPERRIMDIRYDRKKKRMPYRTHDEQYIFPPVYVVSFLNFSLHGESDRILYRYDLRERESGELMTDRINFIFLEMANYHRTRPHPEDGFVEKLSYALTHMRWLEERPAELSEQVFGLLFAACEITSLNKQSQQEYKEDIMTTEMDRQNILYTRELRGYERGHREGREEGREEERAKNAENLKRLGVPIATIAKATELSEEEIAKL